MVSVGSPSLCRPHFAGLKHGQKRHLRLVDLIPMHEAPAGDCEICRAGDEREEGSGNLFTGDRGHRVPSCCKVQIAPLRSPVRRLSQRRAHVGPLRHGHRRQVDARGERLLAADCKAALDAFGSGQAYAESDLYFPIRQMTYRRPPQPPRAHNPHR